MWPSTSLSSEKCHSSHDSVFWQPRGVDDRSSVSMCESRPVCKNLSVSHVTVDLFHLGPSCDLTEVNRGMLMRSHRDFVKCNSHKYTHTGTLCLSLLINAVISPADLTLMAAEDKCCRPSARSTFLISRAGLHFLRVTSRSLSRNSCSRAPNQN